MKRYFFILLLFAQIGFSQFSNSWKGYFSFNEITAVSASANEILVASENSVFSQNSDSNKNHTLNTIDGLSGETISAMYYSNVVGKTIIGYQNGLLTVVEGTAGKITKIIDIVNKSLTSSSKKINHFLDVNGVIYISTDFGIVQFDLKKLQFGDTYFIGNGGAENKVGQTASFNGFLFAATENGIKKADQNSNGLIDSSQWQTVNSGNWSNVIAFADSLFAVNSSASLQKYDSASNTFSAVFQLPDNAKSVQTDGEYLTITTSKRVFVFDKQMNVVRQIQASELNEVTFTSGVTRNNEIHLGTTQKGLFSGSLNPNSGWTNNTPDGPIRNSIFGIHATENNLWTVYGDYDGYYNPYPLDEFGVSKIGTSGWMHIPYESVFDAKSISKIIVNPKNENQVYASSFFSGLLKIENDQPVVLYNQNNSYLESLVLSPPDPSYVDIRINGTAFDKSGTLWITNCRVTNGLKSLSPTGEWQNYSMEYILTSPSETDYSQLTVDKNGTKWIGTSTNGVVGFNESKGGFRKITVGAEFGNLPEKNVKAIAVDTKNQLWIGTTKGLRVLSNINNFTSGGSSNTRAIIIEEDGLAQELMYEQFITDIKVDGANNKWIATADSGVFLFSYNGQKTLQHFTTSNSPLPSNSVNAIDINSRTGEVFFATNNGMVSFKGTATGANDDLNSVFVYPNPVRPEYQGTIKISGLLDKANVKITDVAGNLVHEAISEGGTIEWDGTAFGKYKVASGVYVIFISAQDGGETKIKKVMIVR